MQSSITYDNSVSTLGKGKFTTSQLAFLLLFPGFFFYQTLLGIGTISAFLGGYFAIISLALILPLIFIYLADLKTGKIYFSKIDLYFALFITYFFFIIAFNYLSDANIKIIKSHILSIIYFVNAFIIFKVIDPNDQKFKITAIFSLLAMSVIIFYFSVDGSFYLASLEESINPESVATYQGFARSYLFTFVILIPFIRSILIRTVIYCIAISSLFLNSARSELVALIFLIPVIEVYYAKHKIYIILGIFILISLVALNFSYILDALPNNRILELADLSHSTSVNLRHYLTQQAIQTITSNPFFGDYASYAPGNYAHNILSAWVDLGLFGFIYLSILLTLPALELLFNGYFLQTKSAYFLLAFSLISITLLLLFTSKTFDDMFVGAALGSYTQYKGRKRHE